MQYILPGGVDNLWAEEVTIIAATGLSEAIFTQGGAVVGIEMSAAWTAAKIGYNVSLDNKTYKTAKNNVLTQTTVEGNIFVPIPISDAVFAPFIQLKSVDAADVAVPQAADRTIRVIFKRYLGGSS